MFVLLLEMYSDIPIIDCIILLKNNNVSPNKIFENLMTLKKILQKSILFIFMIYKIAQEKKKLVIFNNYL